MILLLAFVLGEVIAVIKIEAVLWLLLFLVIIKIITKKQTFFAVVFIFLTAGFLISNEQINKRDKLYKRNEETVSLIGSVDKISKSEYGFKIYLKDVFLYGEKYKQLLVVTEEENLRLGNKVRVQGTLSQFESARNEGNFDPKFYYMTQGIYARVKARNIVLISDSYNFIRQRLFYIKQKAEQILGQMCETSENGRVINNIMKDKGQIFSAMLLGEKSQIDRELKELYSVSGIAHILAISGLHISIIGMFLYNAMRRKFRFALSSFVSVIIVVLFGLMAGLGIATMRAITMFILKLLGEVLGRKYDYITAISVAGLFILSDNPFAILNSAFQMSFIAIITITLGWETVKEICSISGKVTEKVVCSLWIGLAMAPIIAINYYQLPTYSFLLNLVVVPLMGVVVVSGVLGIVSGFISIGMGRIMLMPGCGILELYELLCRFINKMPLANVIVGKPDKFTVVCYYCILLTSLYFLKKVKNKHLKVVYNEKNNIEKSGKVIESKELEIKKDTIFNMRYRVVYLIINIVVLLLLYVRVPKGFQVSFLDVGQGDGIFIRCDNGTVVTVDGGSTSENQVGKYRIIPFLKAEGECDIDYSIVTHTDEDHINGLEELLEQSDKKGIRIKNLVMPFLSQTDDRYKSLVERAKFHKVNVLYIKKGDRLQFGEVKIDCISPIYEGIYDDKNDSSTVVSLEYGRLSILFTGDISSKVEAKLRTDLKSHYTFLKVPHHGSKYSASDEFLSWINPDYSVVSVGENNMYGHPNQDTMARIEKNHSILLRTDIAGGITIKSNGERISIKKKLK